MIYIAHKRMTDGEEQSAREHAEAVALYCSKWAERMGLSNFAGLIGKLHDMGKTTKDFTKYLRNCFNGVVEKRSRSSIDHSTAGAQYLYDTFYSGDAFDKLIVEIGAIIICSHHGGLINYLDLECRSEFLERMVKDKNEIRYNEAIYNFFEYCYSEDQLKSEFAKAKEEMSIILKTDSKNSKITRFMDVSLLIKYLFSCLIDADRLDTYLFMESKDYLAEVDPNWDRLYEEMEGFIKEKEETCKERCKEGSKSSQEINSLRSKISEECRNFAERETKIYSLTVPTGGGKTFSSFRYALHHAQLYQKDRIIYVVPFTTIIEQNVSEIVSIFKGKQFILEDHSNVMEDNENEDYKLLTERWNSPIIFTTMVQFLNTIYKGKTQNIRRMHHLSNAVIIFDEVQAVPLKCTNLFNEALNFLYKACNSTIILCTATQPAFEDTKRPLMREAAAEIISNTSEVFERFKRVDVKPILKADGYSCEQLAKLICQEEEKSDSILIIVNTKTAAETLFDQVIDRNKERSGASKCKVFHLSTKMCPAHRRNCIEKIRSSLNNKEKIICISTQLIEAGVDISFQCVFRALAGLDSIAQAAGRCNRHGQEKTGSVYVFNLQEDLSKLPDINIGQDCSLRIMHELERNPDINYDLLSSEVMKRYFYYYFHDKDNRSQMDFPITLNQTVNTSICNILSKNKKGEEFYRNRMGKSFELKLKFACKTAGEEFYVIPENTISVLVPYGNGKNLIMDMSNTNDLHELNQLIRQAQNFTVNLFQYEIDAIKKNDGLVFLDNCGIFTVKEEFYDEKIGLTTTPGIMGFLNF